MARPPRWVRRLLSDADLEAIAEAIRHAESRTSGEIRVHLERRLPWRTRDPLARARGLFHRLGMHRTRDRHGVLIYVALGSRKLAVVGDAGIHERAGDDHWERVRDLMVERLREGSARDALVGAVDEVGRELARHFPRSPDDRNELSDDVTVS